MKSKSKLSSNLYQDHPKGFTFIEILFSLLIIGILSATFFKALNNSIKPLKTSFNLIAIEEESLHYFSRKFKGFSKLSEVSQAQSNQGFIHYLDKDRNEITIFHNHTKNQIKFGQNNFKQNTLVYQTKNQKPEKILDDISEFKIELFSEPPLQQDSAPINKIPLIKNKKISGLKFVFTNEENKKFQLYRCQAPN